MIPKNSQQMPTDVLYTSFFSLGIVFAIGGGCGRKQDVFAGTV